MDDAHGTDPSIFMPPPPNMNAVLRIQNHKVRRAWIRACKKEIGTLIKRKTFKLVDPPKNTKIIPVMEDLRVKILEDGSLDKFKHLTEVSNYSLPMHQNTNAESSNSIL